MSALGYYRPAGMQDLLRVKEELKDRALLLAGGSNLMVYIKEGSIREGLLVDIFSLPELKGIRRQNGCLEIGAAEVMADLLESELLRDSFPLLAQMLAGFANPLVRNRATLGGNIADASPIADTVPPLLCLQAELVVAGRGGERVVPLDRFFGGPGRTTLHHDEVIVKVRVPVPKQGRGSFQKLGLRNGTSCSVTSVAVWLEAAGGKVMDIRIACGGVAPTPVRAPNTEKAFQGARLEREEIARLAAQVQKDISPISDARGSAEYRREVTARLLARAVRQAAGMGEQ